MLRQNKNNNGYIESPVDDNHLLHKINKYIDFSFTRNLVISSYSKEHGRPSIDPEIFFRMLFISYAYNISSDRRLCQEIRYNLCYRWFCKIRLKDKVPDHSWLSKTRKRFGEKVFAELFTTILELCRKHGLLDSSIIITDSSLIKANASLDSLIPMDAEAAAGEKSARQNAKSKLGPPASRGISNSTHISKTDKESSLAKKEGSPRELKYKIHNSIDGLSRVIIDTKVTSGKTHESQVYIERLNHIAQKHCLAIKEVIADRDTVLFVNTLKEKIILITLFVKQLKVCCFKFITASGSSLKARSEVSYFTPCPFIATGMNGYNLKVAVFKLLIIWRQKLYLFLILHRSNVAVYAWPLL